MDVGLFSGLRSRLLNISHFSVDVGLFSGLRSRLNNICHFSVDVGLFSSFRSRLNNICCFSVDVGLFSSFRSRLNNICHFSLDVGLFQVSDPEGKGRGTQGRGPRWGDMQVTSSVAKPVSGRKWRLPCCCWSWFPCRFFC